ncbi:probable dehydrogenases with different specificities (related to short-chain alcohol dehydrogenases) [Ramularia collo-cygni]|uniref:Probable dehydrogenases with different specificities (Related to short-chain alcohol dehydrogenases) n=1 Tax=Ramularia collo-cygni TaxID=112498 RepID=A0A2D3VQF0_9PEZI|nr:probable dehydrogenases with different specificities (related to short-chain alcohol dehydrogenases) [Ramularia collo-cygni]CZT25504.1 probable dehydrogenases with different specificities (related to short-chain alcohol dehydrogenases) [Ramularia collo-cygni]
MSTNGQSNGTAQHETARASLAAREIPHMVLGDKSQKGPSAALDSNPEERARLRFAVSGNAIVTGGAGTLGFEACSALLEHGLSGLVIFDMSVEQNTTAVKLLQSRFPGRNIDAYRVDVTDDAAVEAAVQKASMWLGSLNHLLCFSGIVGCVHSMDVSAAEWRRVVDVNTTGSFLCAQSVARLMKVQNTGGSITFTASISAHRVNFPQPQAAYNVSKAGLVTLKNCLAAEWAQHGIRVNSISPGYMDTVLNEGDGLATARATWTDRNPTGRLGQPGELTGAVVLLTSNAGSYINGADIVIDGGAIVF